MTIKAVISGYYGFGNFGDELILSVLVQHLKSKNAQITVLSSNPEKTSKENFVNAVYSFNINQITDSIRHSDILISGGGSLLQDATSVKSLLYYIFIIFLALIYRKEVIIFAQGIGPINNIFAKFLTIQILKKCKYISVRDNISQIFLEHNGIKSDLVCDPVYSLEILQNDQKGIVGVQLRDFKTMNDTLLSKLAKQIVKEFCDKKIRIFALQESVDMEVCLKFQKMLKNFCPDIRTEVVSDNIIYNIYELEYMIGMRFHAIVTALKAGVKCIGINYDIKVEKLAKDSGIPLISMDACEDFDKVFNDMKNLDAEKIKAEAYSQKFDWAGIDNILALCSIEKS